MVTLGSEESAVNKNVSSISKPSRDDISMVIHREKRCAILDPKGVLNEHDGVLNSDSAQ